MHEDHKPLSRASSTDLSLSPLYVVGICSGRGGTSGGGATTIIASKMG